MARDGPSTLKTPELSELYLEEKRLPLILSRLLTPTSCGIDVGAHIGSFLSLLIYYAPKGKHIAIEPSVTKSNWLKEQFPLVKVYSVAVSDQSGWAFFEENLATPGLSRLAERSDTTDRSCYKVVTRSLDDLTIGHVDLLKLDIEGGELAALRGARQLINGCRPAILFECGPTCENRREIYQELTDIYEYNLLTFSDFLFPDKGPLSFDEFRKCGVYPFRAFNFIALARPQSHKTRNDFL